MNKRVMLISAITAAAVIGILVFAWMNWSRKYMVRWHMPFRRGNSVQAVTGNVCVEPEGGVSYSPSDCAEVLLFPHVYSAIGVDEQRFIAWQEADGFHSEGIDRAGNLLAPGYPTFSRLAWTVIDPVSLRGDELSDLIEECNRIRQRSTDPKVLLSIDRLVDLAGKAKRESKALRLS
jgi:hypothetical protein